jgi:endogenous inhibitor of DNA gyrase (YacG/DUF329 family)
LITNTCEECGAKTLTYPSQPRRFCSLSCRSKFQARTQMPTKPRRGVSLPCETCGKPVYRSKAQTTKRFCSRECLTEASRTSITKTCPNCGDAFKTAPSADLTYCGRDCYEAARRVASSAGRMHNGRHAIVDHKGYIRIWEPDHPAASQGRVLEHRWVMEQHLGRRLASDEHVHHVNGVKDDNRLENLEVLSHSDHSRVTSAERKAQLDELLERSAELAEYRRRFGPLT